jgi:PAS domain S-box-containing protein
MTTTPVHPVDFGTDAERFHFLVDAVTDYAIYLLDNDGFVRSWNSGAERLKGYLPGEIIGRHYSNFFTPEDRSGKLPWKILDAVRDQGRHETEGWRVRKDGSRFWASAVIHKVRDAEGRHIGFAKVTRDITARKAAHDALVDSERKFRILVHGVTDYAIYMLDPNGIVTNWNPGAERIKQYTADEIVGQHFSRFYTDSDRAAGKPARALHISATEGRFEAEGWRVRKDGTLFWANVVIDPIRDEQGALLGYSKITRDITERREAQKVLQETQTQLAQVQKMEALGQLTGGVAHDFNNLLMVVSGYIPMIKQRMVDDPRGLRAAEAIEAAAKNGAALTRQLLSFSRRQTLNPTVIKLNETVEAARPILKSVAGGTVKCEIWIPATVWPVRSDPSELELAVINLCVNARDAMEHGGTISISAENVRLTGKEFASELQGDFVALTVADTGHGIPPDILAKVFDPFFTTKGVGKGTGLGLSQVHGFTHQAGGTIGITSSVGHGTQVTLYLPRAGEDAPATGQTGPHEIQAAGRKVLLVEDNPEVAAASAELLARLGCTVNTVGGAKEALQALHNGSFDLVLTDIVMPGAMNGLDLARMIRKERPHLGIVLATGYSDAAVRASLEFPLLRKPYDISDLNKAMAQSDEQRQAAPQPSNVLELKGLRRKGMPSERPPEA